MSTEDGLDLLAIYSNIHHLKPFLNGRIRKDWWNTNPQEIQVTVWFRFDNVVRQVIAVNDDGLIEDCDFGKKKIIFSDEAHFDLRGYVNKQN